MEGGEALKSRMSKQQHNGANANAAALGHDMGRFTPPDEQGYQAAYCGNEGCTAKFDYDNLDNEDRIMGTALTEPCPY